MRAEMPEIGETRSQAIGTLLQPRCSSAGLAPGLLNSIQGIEPRNGIVALHRDNLKYGPAGKSRVSNPPLGSLNGRRGFEFFAERQRAGEPDRR
jgi:hypothetical protein